MVLEYDNKGQPGPKWRRQYANQVGICSRKIPITLVMRQVPPGLIQAFWDDTRVSVFLAHLDNLRYLNLMVVTK